jgi:DnaJ-class molecular chaperone
VPFEIKGYRPWHDLAGKMPDQELASRFGITQGGVGNYRRSQGIPPFRTEKRCSKCRGPGPFHKRAAWKGQKPTLSSQCKACVNERHQVTRNSDEGKKQKAGHFLGTVPDALLARKHGLSKTTVSTYRKKAGIPQYARKAF